MRNLDIRTEVKQAGLKLWQVADQLGMSDSSFSRYLRYELDNEKKAEIRRIINNMSSGKRK